LKNAALPFHGPISPFQSTATNSSLYNGSKGLGKKVTLHSKLPEKEVFPLPISRMAAFHLSSAPPARSRIALKPTSLESFLPSFF